jgi:hypothetical protein
VSGFEEGFDAAAAASEVRMAPATYSAGFSFVDAVSITARASATLPPFAAFSFASCPPAFLPKSALPLAK